MRIDAYTHFFPKKFFDKMNEVAGDYKDMGKRVRSLPLKNHDLRKAYRNGNFPETFTVTNIVPAVIISNMVINHIG